MNWMNFLNDYTKPILFVALIMSLVFLFPELFLGFGIIFGLVISFVVFYYFGKTHDGWLYVASLFVLTLAWDLVQPPYAVDINGVLNNSIFFSVSSIDYAMGSFFSGLGFYGNLLFFMTYVGGFALLFSFALFLGKMTKKRRSIKG